MIEAIVLCTIFGTFFGVFIIVAYSLGLKNGQRISKNEEVVVPNVNPIKVITEEKERHEEKKKQEAYEIMMSNIDNYDGTGLGQKDIPN